MSKIRKNIPRVNFASIDSTMDYPDFLDIQVKTFNQFYSWVDAVNFGFVQSELHGWNNEAKTYESINQVMPCLIIETFLILTTFIKT